MTTLYDTLGLRRDASASDIEQRYHHSLNAHIAGKRSHPLRKKDQLRLQEIRQAYLVLSSPSRRLEYDLQLDQKEQDRLGRIERLGTIFGLALLVAGLMLIWRGYDRFQQPALVEKVRDARLETAMLASQTASPPPAQPDAERK